MRLVFGLVLLVGIALAGTAVYLARDFIGQQEARLAAAERAKEAIVPVADVYVVNKQMRYGQRLTIDDVKLVRWPVSAIPEGAFASEEALFPEGTDVPRAILRTMEPDEAVLAPKVTGAGEEAGVSSRLSPGMRAFTIVTNAQTGVSGFLRPGDRVDVYWTGSAQGRGVTQLIDANIRIIAINQSAEEDVSEGTIARTVTVEVNPRQVASLAQAQQTGRLSLSLVGADDVIVSDAVEVDLGDVLGIEEQEVVEVEEEQVCTSRVRQGTQIVVVEIPCTN